jgi:4-hydroxy-2-oxoheptanedioate aldolase
MPETAARRVNRAIEALAQGRAIYYTGHHSGHVLTHAQGMRDAGTWADYINIGMEHGAFDPAGLAAYMQGLADAGPQPSGHLTPAVVVEAPVNGIDEASVRYNAWQFRQILGRGVHGIILCQTESAGAVRAFVESCRYPHHTHGTDPAAATPHARMRGAPPAGEDRTNAPNWLGVGRRGRGSEPSAAPVWGLTEAEYMRRCDPWPLNPEGELLLGVKIESPEGVARCDEILAVPGIGYAELGPGDLGLALGYTELRLEPYPPEMRAARHRVFAACRASGLAFLEACTPETVVARINEGVRIIAGDREDTAIAGRAHQQRALRG